MEEHVRVLSGRKKELEELIRRKEKEVASAPEGYLRIQDRKTYVEYYWRRDPNDRNGVFIPKREWHIANDVAQREYDSRLLALARREQKLLTKYLSFSEKNELASVYDRLSDRRKELVTPYRIPDIDYVRQWMEIPYEPMGFEENETEYYTDGGIRVRSKSEIIIANMLEKFGVPYKYECQLKLGKRGVVRPDFTCLNIRTRKEYVWEHFGMMDVEEYARKNIQKISYYEENGFFEGDNMIMTFETSVTPVNSSLIKTMIRRNLL